jgi:hypothetical protein
MTEQTLVGHLATPVKIDVCFPCQAFWFDGYESLRLSPGSVLALFKLIGEQTPSKPVALSDLSTCPRCHMRLAPTHDQQRNTRFEYLRCPAKHGRLTSFFNFLREKDFVRPLTPQQVEELRRNVQSVNCSNCGAAVDLVRGVECAHCGSPLSMLDMRQAQTLVETLRQADAGKMHDPSWPMRAELARRETEVAFQTFERDASWVHQASSAGLVGAGLSTLARWLLRNNR